MRKTAILASVLTPVEKEWLVAELADFLGKTLLK
jgi:hypothetical protein